MGMIFELIGQPLGWIMSLIFKLVDNYLITIFLFTFLVRVLLFPIYLKQQKSSMDRARLAPRLERLQKKYANDRQKLAQKQQELYERHGVSMTGGCLPMLLSMLVLFGVIGVIYAPVTNLGIAPDQVSVMAEQAVVLEGKVDAKEMIGYYGELYMLQNADECRDAIIKKIDEPTMADINWAYKLTGTDSEFKDANSEEYLAQLAKYKADVKNTMTETEYMVDINNDGTVTGGEYYYSKITEMEDQFVLFEGFSLLDKPWNEKGFGGINVLWIIPLISGATAFLVSFVSTRYNKRSMPQQQAGAGCMTGGMMIYMPAVSLFIAFGVPGAVGIYWIMSNLFSLLQTVVLNKIYDPAKARAEAEAEYQERRRKKAEDKKRLAMARQREEAEARKAEQALERQREESREMNKKKKKKGSSAPQKQAEETDNGATDAVDTQPETNTDNNESAE